MLGVPIWFCNKMYFKVEWALRAQLKNVQRQVEEMCDYLLYQFPPFNEEGEKLAGKIIKRKREVERMKKRIRK